MAVRAALAIGLAQSPACHRRITVAERSGREADQRWVQVVVDRETERSEAGRESPESGTLGGAKSFFPPSECVGKKSLLPGGNRTCKGDCKEPNHSRSKLWMKTRRAFLLPVLIAALVGIILMLSAREPRHHGRSLTSWLQQCSDASLMETQRLAEAQAVVGAMAEPELELTLQINFVFS